MERNKETTTDRLTYGVAEAAKLLGVSYWTMGDLVRTYKIPHVRIGNVTKRSRVLILKKDLNAFLESRKITSPEDAIRLMNGRRKA